MNKLITIFLLIVGGFLWIWPTSNGSTIGDRYVIQPIYDSSDLPSPGNPDHPIYQKWRDQRRSGETEIAKAIPATVDLKNYVSSNSQRATDVKDWTEGEQKLHAIAKGLTLSDQPDAIVEADVWAWQTMKCVNVGTQKEEPCEFFPGDVIGASGEVKSSWLTDNATHLPIPIGPCGTLYTDQHVTPFVDWLPRYGLIGQIRYPNGGTSKGFSICESYTVQEHGFLEAMVNGDYRLNNYPHSEWFGSYTGRFHLRIKNKA